MTLVTRRLGIKVLILVLLALCRVGVPIMESTWKFRLGVLVFP